MNIGEAVFVIIGQITVAVLGAILFTNVIKWLFLIFRHVIFSKFSVKYSDNKSKHRYDSIYIPKHIQYLRRFIPLKSKINTITPTDDVKQFNNREQSPLENHTPDTINNPISILKEEPTNNTNHAVNSSIGKEGKQPNANVTLTWHLSTVQEWGKC